MALSLGVGLTLGILIAAGEAGIAPLSHRLPRLLQAHGWTQLQGWIGLFVAGMSLRVVPRIGGRPPLPSALTISVLVLLTSGLVLRVEGARPGPESWLSWPALMAATALRVMAAGLPGSLHTTLIAASGLLAWVGLAAFAWGLLRARFKRSRPAPAGMSA